MRKAVLVTVTAGLVLGGTGMAFADQGGPAATGVGADGGAAAPAAALTPAQAGNEVLRAAGGGRVVGVQVAEAGGRTLYRVRFVSGNRLRTATVDAATGQVLGAPGAGAAGGGTAGLTGNVPGDNRDDDGDDRDDGGDDDDGDDDDDDDDGDDGDDDGNDDDDDGPVRPGTEPNK
ncbi:MAG TPA: PepSY domain-containing protein [Pilimelia sp.]|nr:PepSY domain-containing protein [Pilimelia sp.]